MTTQITKEELIRNYGYKMNAVRQAIDNAQQQLWNLPVTDTRFNELKRADSKELSVQLIPIIKCFKRDRNRLIMPNGARIRLSKLRFQFVESIDKPDCEWNDISFKVLENTSIIQYTFSLIYPDKNGFPSQEETEKEYNFSGDYIRRRCHDAMSLLAYKTNDEIEATAIYGVKAPKVDAKLEHQRAHLNHRIDTYREVLKQLNLVVAMERSKDSLNNAFSGNHSLKYFKDVEKSLKSFQSTFNIYKR